MILKHSRKPSRGGLKRTYTDPAAGPLPAAPAKTPAVRAPNNQLPSLLRLQVTWRFLNWWTLAYGAACWLLEYGFSRLDRASAMHFLSGLDRLVYAVMWSAALIVAIAATELLPVTQRRQIGRIATHLLLCLLVAVLWGSVSYYVCLLIVPGWQPLGVPHMLSQTTKIILFGYGLAVVLMHIVLQLRRHRQQEVTLLRQAHLATEAQLQLLKLEIQPHFLFNALHSVSALIHSNPDAANDTLVLVSDMLRHAIDTARVQEVPLREELATLRLYTQIQQVRFGDRLRLSWDIEEASLEAAVPHMLLQPLVENAIKHGLETHSSAGKIRITARRDEGMLRLTIRDDGPGLGVPSPRRGAGLGLVNVRTRLAQLYGEHQTFSVDDARGGGTEVLIRLPLCLRAWPTAYRDVPSENRPRSERVLEAAPVSVDDPKWQETSNRL